MATYDKDLERWIPRLIAVWRKSIRARGGPEGRLTPSEHRQIAAAIRRLSFGLTRERSLVGSRYMEDPLLLGAYLLFYWPISYAQAREVLGEIRHRPRTTLDVGSGPAPLAFAALDAGATEATAADRSVKALAMARALAAEAGEGLGTREWELRPGAASWFAGRLRSDERFDLIGLGHLVNELFGGDERALEKRTALVEETLSRVTPNGSVVIIEPALRETSRALLQVRDGLVARGFAVRAPCLYRGNCPALIKESDWCHAERAWRPPPLVEGLATAAGLHKESLKMSYLVMAPKGEPWQEAPPGAVFRIVSEPLAGKGRRRFIGCGPAGRVGLALQEKHRTDGNAAFSVLARGDVIRVTASEPRGDGLALTPTSLVEVLARAGEPVPK
jgi:hypothetical protein